MAMAMKMAVAMVMALPILVKSYVYKII
jgi:hypothetical protein